MVFVSLVRLVALVPCNACVYWGSCKDSFHPTKDLFGNIVFPNCSFSNTKVYFSYDITVVYNASVFEYNSIQYIKVFGKNFGWDQSARH
jgi:hypothetical protein